MTAEKAESKSTGDGSLMYDDPAIKRNWREVIQWDKMNIRGFFGEYRWLSNFQPCVVWFEGLRYGSSEAAYMAAKSDDPDIRMRLTKLTAYEAKKLGRTIKLRDDWKDLRVDFMRRILVEKFLMNAHLKAKLLTTDEKYLEETNWWQDRFWGVCDGSGENNLGKIIMGIREMIKP